MNRYSSGACAFGNQLSMWCTIDEDGIVAAIDQALREFGAGNAVGPICAEDGRANETEQEREARAFTASLRELICKMRAGRHTAWAADDCLPPFGASELKRDQPYLSVTCAGLLVAQCENVLEDAAPCLLDFCDAACGMLAAASESDRLDALAGNQKDTRLYMRATGSASPLPTMNATSPGGFRPTMSAEDIADVVWARALRGIEKSACSLRSSGGVTIIPSTSLWQQVTGESTDEYLPGGAERYLEKNQQKKSNQSEDRRNSR